MLIIFYFALNALSCILFLVIFLFLVCELCVKVVLDDVGSFWWLLSGNLIVYALHVVARATSMICGVNFLLLRTKISGDIRRLSLWLH